MNCDICDGVYKDWAVRGDEKIVVRCYKCGIIRLEIFPDESEINSWYSDEDYYSGNAHSGYNSSYVSYIDSRINDENSWPYDLFKFMAKNDWIDDTGKLLDIGCGGGLFAGCFKRKGWDVLGIDMNPDSLKISGKYNVPVKICNFENSNFTSEEFDLLHANDFIEHVQDPAFVFSEMNRILKPGGILTLSTMNGDRSILRKSSWAAFNSSYEHLWYFNRKSLKLYCEMNGFELLKVIYSDLNPGFLRKKIFPLLGLGNIIRIFARKSEFPS